MYDEITCIWMATRHSAVYERCMTSWNSSEDKSRHSSFHSSTNMRLFQQNCGRPFICKVSHQSLTTKLYVTKLRHNTVQLRAGSNELFYRETSPFPLAQISPEFSTSVWPLCTFSSVEKDATELPMPIHPRNFQPQLAKNRHRTGTRWWVYPNR